MKARDRYERNFLIAVVCGVCAQQATKKSYSKKTQGKGILLFGTVAVFAAALFFLVTAGKLEWNSTISAGGVVATFFVSTLFYKEKLSRQQIIGFAIGAVSVVLLNL